MSSHGQNAENSILQQCDGRHERDGLSVMKLGWLMVVSRVTGRPSWSPGRNSSIDRHLGVEL